MTKTQARGTVPFVALFSAFASPSLDFYTRRSFFALVLLSSALTQYPSLRSRRRVVVCYTLTPTDCRCLQAGSRGKRYILSEIRPSTGACSTFKCGETATCSVERQRTEPTTRQRVAAADDIRVAEEHVSKQRSHHAGERKEEINK